MRADRIDAFDRPVGWFRGPGLPRFALHTHLAVRHVLDAQLQRLPGIRRPGEVLGHRSLYFRLPRLDLQLLIGTVEDERVGLRRDADVALLTPFRWCADVRLDRVVGERRRAD